MQITVTLTESALLIFLQSVVKKLLAWQPGIEPTTLDLSSQSGAYDLSATVTPQSIQLFWWLRPAPQFITKSRFPKNVKTKFSQIQFSKMHFLKKYWPAYPNQT